MYTLQGKPDQHTTHIPRSICVWSQTICISRSQCIATFREVINNGGQSHYSWEKGLRHNPSYDGSPIRGSITSFSPEPAIEAMGVKPPSVDGRLLGLPGPYHQHAIGTLNTCSQGPTHRSLTNTGGATTLKVLAFLVPLPDLPNWWSSLST
jgi:hypothetical protein